MDRKTLKIKANTDNIVTFLYDTPIEGNNQYGTYHLYAFNHAGEEVSLFATDALHEKLKNFVTGDSINIRKDEYESNKFGWNIIPQEGTPLRNSPTPYSSKSEPSAAMQETREYHAKQSDARTKDIHKQVCLKLAVQSMNTEEGMDYGEVKERMNALLEILENDLPF